MLRKISIISLILIMLGISSSWSSSRIGSASYKAKQAYLQGNLEYSYMLWQKALQEAVTQGNKNYEAKVILNMAALYMTSENWSKADSLINLISTKKKYSSKTVKLMFLTRMRLKNSQGNYKIVEDIYEDFLTKNSQWELKDDILVQDILSEVVIAKASLKKDYNEIWGELSSEMDNESGRYYFLKAKLSLQRSAAEDALENLNLALKKAQLGERKYKIGEILYLTAKTFEALGQKEAAIMAYSQAFQLYRELELAIPYIKSLEHYLKLKPNSSLQKELDIFKGYF